VGEDDLGNHGANNVHVQVGGDLCGGGEAGSWDVHYAHGHPKRFMNWLVLDGTISISRGVGIPCRSLGMSAAPLRTNHELMLCCPALQALHKRAAEESCKVVVVLAKVELELNGMPAEEACCSAAAACTLGLTKTYMLSAALSCRRCASVLPRRAAKSLSCQQKWSLSS
jgi:hypothetical protein